MGLGCNFQIRQTCVPAQLLEFFCLEKACQKTLVLITIPGAGYYPRYAKCCLRRRRAPIDLSFPKIRSAFSNTTQELVSHCGSQWCIKQIGHLSQVLDKRLGLYAKGIVNKLI